MKSGMMLLVLLFSWCLYSVDATHFAFGTMSWVRDLADPNRIKIVMQQALRASYFDNGNFASSAVEGVSTTGNVGRFTCEPALCADDPVQAGFLKWSTSGRKFHDSAEERPPRDCLFLDNSNAYINTDVEFVVQIMYAEDDYFTGEFEYNFDIPQWEYAGGWTGATADWHCYFYSYARITGLMESNDNTYSSGGDLALVLSTIIKPDVAASPYSVGLPREYAAVNNTWTFNVPADTTSGGNIHWELPAGFDVQWEGIGDMWLWDDSTTWKNWNANLRTIVPGSESGYTMDTSQLYDAGVLTWLIPPGSYTFPMLFSMHIHIVDDATGVFIPYDFTIEVIEIC